MNFLGVLFNDESFNAYLDESPIPNVAIVGGSPPMRQLLADGIRQSQTIQSRFRVSQFASAGEMLPKTPPHATYEGHRVGAVFKRNWCKKHLQSIFGCVALLIDWDNVKINDKHQFEQHVAQLVDSLRSQVRNSTSTRVMLVLITKLSSSDAPPGGFYPSSEDAQSGLRSKLGLDTKSLAVVYRDGVDEYSVGRLQRMISDHCVKYHRDEIAKIKRMKGDAHKSPNAALLQARLRFKAGWHCLVLQDHKLMKYNLEKGYDTLQQFISGPSSPAGISERVSATLIMWTMVASNFNQLAAASSPKQDLILDMLEVTVSTFLRHLTLNVLQPYSSVFLGTLDPSGVYLLQIMHQIYLAEWYEMLSKKIQFVLDAHRIVPKRHHLSINPGIHLQTASRWWDLVQQSICNLGSGFSGSQSTPVLAPLLHIGTECRSPVYLRAILTSLNTSVTSNKSFELLQGGKGYIAAAGMPRAMLRVLYGVALHFFTVGDFVACYEKIRHVLQSGESNGTVMSDTILCALHKLMIQACRKIMQRKFKDEPSEDTTLHDPSYMHHVGVNLVRSMLALLGNRCVDADAHRVIQSELARMLKDQHMPLADGAFFVADDASNKRDRSTFSASAFFSKPFFESRGTADSPTLEISLETLSRVPIHIVELAVEICRVHAVRTVLNSSGLRASPEVIQYTSVRDHTSEKAVNQKLLKMKKTYQVVSSDRCARMALKVSFHDEGIYEVTALVASWQVGDGVVLALRIPIAQPANYALYRRLDNHAYDPTLEHWDSSLNLGDPRQRNRPVVRVVAPISWVQLHLLQAEQAVEGEEYPVEIVITNTHRTLDAAEMTLVVPWIPGTLDVLQESNTSNDAFVLTQVPHDDTKRVLCPEGYELSAGAAKQFKIGPGEVLRWTLYFRCHKGGKFELPVRLHYSTKHCQTMVATKLLTLHVCHPVFATFHILGTQAGSMNGVPTHTPTSAQMLQFVESSVLRDANTVAGDVLSQYAHLGRVPRIDNDFLKRHDASKTGFVTLNNMLYTVEHMQMPCDSKRALEARYESPLYVSCKFSNSLQCPVTINSVDVHLDERIALHGADVSQLWCDSGILPCTLGVDEDITLGLSVVGMTPRAQQRIGADSNLIGLGSLTLHLQRSITAIGGSGSESSIFTFELPLPSIEFKANSILCFLDVPPTVVAGEAFYGVLRMENTSSEPKHVEVHVLPPQHPSPSQIVLGGRGRWTTTLFPKEGKKTTLKFFPTCSGVLLLPTLTVRCTSTNTVLMRPEERRLLVSLPSTQQ
jgi:hypothetical protein